MPVVPLPPRETPEQKAERERELHRQRQQRYADRKRAAQGGEIPATMLESEPEPAASRPPVMGHVTPLAGSPADAHPRFSLKLPFLEKRHGDGKPEKVRLFSSKEVEEKLEKFTEIYQRGSGLLDDILEIVTKDHEPVRIWQLDEEDAATMATMHLERARFDEGAARSARKLEEIYDRFFFWFLVGPRLKASYSYVHEHGGFSFK